MRRSGLSLLLLLTSLTLVPPRLAAQATQQQQQPSPSTTQAQPSPLKTPARQNSNAEIEAMLDARLPAGVVVARIEGCGCAFDTSADALRRLKEKGAADEVLLAVVRASAPPQVAAAAAASVVVPAGTVVEVAAAHHVSSAEVRAGDTLGFRVARPVEVGGVMVIAKGALATARVVEAKKGRPFGKAGRLVFEMRDVEAADGRKIPLGLGARLKGDSKGGTVATAAAVTAVLFFPAAPLWGFKRGKSAVIPPGKIFNAAVAADTAVTVKPAR